MIDKLRRARPRQLAKAASLLARVSRMPGAAEPSGRQGHGKDTGTPFHIYEPSGQICATVVAPPGLSLNAARDHRLVHFARCLAQGGVRAVVPTLPGLAACRFDADDVVALADVCSSVAEQAATRVTLIGFSVAGSYALVAASQAREPDPIRLVLAVGAYHRLTDVLEYHQGRRPSHLMPEEQQEAELYLRLALAHGHARELRVPAEAAEPARPLLAEFASKSPVVASQILYDQKLRDLELVAGASRRLPPELADAISPAGKLASLRCPVRLLHAHGDALVPRDQCHELMAELDQARAGGDQRALVTPLLSHVTLAGALQLRDVCRLLSAFSLVFE